MAKKIKDQNIEAGEQQEQAVEEKAERRMTFRASEKFSADVAQFAAARGLKPTYVKAVLDAEIQKFIEALDVKELVKSALFGE